MQTQRFNLKIKTMIHQVLIWNDQLVHSAKNQTVNNINFEACEKLKKYQQ